MGESAPDLRDRYAEVLRFVRRRAPNPADAEEITQTVFAEAAASLAAGGREAAPPLAWLYTVAQRRLIDQARRRASRGTPLPLRDDAGRGYEAAYGREVATALRKAMAALPRGQRQVVVARLVEGRPFAEIAERLGTTEAACKMRFRRGLVAVRATFEREGIEP
jgi:RNA polymerase sigma-70 factor (ECF subfamily)